MPTEKDVCECFNMIMALMEWANNYEMALTPFIKTALLSIIEDSLTQLHHMGD